MTVRLRLDICYDGTAFSGWAVQPGRRTVAGVMGAALDTLFRAPVPIVVAGRTDAGVHATGQVAHIDVDAAALAALTPRRLRHAEGTGSDPTGSNPTGAALIGLRRRLAGLLPEDVRVPDVRVAPNGFDARFSALRRRYRYRIAVSEWGVPPLRRLSVLARRHALDADAMNRAADRLTGLHDFAAYCKPRVGGTTVRDLQELRVDARRMAEADGRWVEIVAVADAFCHSMVRGLVGALIAVGEGRMDETRPAGILAARVRTTEVAVAPACGLTLEAVEYPADDDLAARAQATRAVRDHPPR